MSEAVELILTGVVCESCGEWMEDLDELEDIPGHPRQCESCREGEEDER